MPSRRATIDDGLRHLDAGAISGVRHGPQDRQDQNPKDR